MLYSERSGLFEQYQNLSFITWPRQKVDSMYKEEAKKIRDDVKKKLQKRLDKILNYSSVEANQDILDMYQILKKLENLILEYQQEFKKKKREKNIVDFSDVEHFALQILCHQTEEGTIEKTAIAKTYEEKFEEIAIDEYQDSNLVQEYILKAISRGNNIFMVGDVKQSIYKFRQAMSELFLSKYASYPLKEKQNGEENLKIQLFKNFRSRENVLDFTNLIFQDIMSENLRYIYYDKEEYLHLGASYEENGQHLETEITVIDLKEQEECLAGGSGPVCSALVSFGYIYHEMKKKNLKRVLIVATGALFSPTMVYQKENIYSIANAISLEVV